MIELYHFWSSVCSVKVRMCLESFQVSASWPDETGGGYEEVGLRASLPTAPAGTGH